MLFSQNSLLPLEITFYQGTKIVANLVIMIKVLLLFHWQDNSISTWDDIVFIPPGFDVSTDPKKQQ